MAITVIATALGYYGLQLRKKGDVFTIKDESEMGKWMRVTKAQVQAPDDDEAPAPVKAPPSGKSKAGSRASDESKI